MSAGHFRSGVRVEGHSETGFVFLKELSGTEWEHASEDLILVLRGLVRPARRLRQDSTRDECGHLGELVAVEVALDFEVVVGLDVDPEPVIDTECLR